MIHSTETLWNDMHGAIGAFVRKRVSDHEDARDIVQETFIKIHDNIDRLNDETKISSWAFQIARNAIVDYYRRKRTTTELPEDIVADEPSHKDVEQIVASWLEEMTEDLPEKYREAIRLAEFEELSQKEIGRRLGISYSGAKSRVQRAREQLKKVLLECCHLEFDRRGGIIGYTSLTACCTQCGDDCDHTMQKST